MKPYASLSYLLFTNPTGAIKSVSHSPVDKNSLKILTQIKHIYKVPSISIYTPFCHNHAFTPVLLDNTFDTWFAKGLKSIKYFYLNNKFASFVQLSLMYYLPMELLSLSPETKMLITKCVNLFSNDC